jgi:RNA polymerase sigma-70 factor (ECF subfamily)
VENVQTQNLDEYVQHLTAFQSRLRGYILASLGNHANTADVLQRTNLTLWKKAHEFRPGADFAPWALAITRYEILAFLRDHRRDRHVFSDDVAELMLDAAVTEVPDPGDRQMALRTCLEKLPRRSRDLLWSRYDADKSIKQIASETNRSEDSVKSLFLRIRKSLERCIEMTLKLDGI